MEASLIRQRLTNWVGKKSTLASVVEALETDGDRENVSYWWVHVSHFPKLAQEDDRKKWAVFIPGIPYTSDWIDGDTLKDWAVNGNIIQDKNNDKNTSVPRTYGKGGLSTV